METQNKRGKIDAYFREPETEVDRENPFLYHPTKEEEWRTQTGSGRVRTPKRS